MGSQVDMANPLQAQALPTRDYSLNNAIGRLNKAQPEKAHRKRRGVRELKKTKEALRVKRFLLIAAYPICVACLSARHEAISPGAYRVMSPSLTMEEGRKSH